MYTHGLLPHFVLNTFFLLFPLFLSNEKFTNGVSSFPIYLQTKFICKLPFHLHFPFSLAKTLFCLGVLLPEIPKPAPEQEQTGARLCDQQPGPSGFVYLLSSFRVYVSLFTHDFPRVDYHLFPLLHLHEYLDIVKFLLLQSSSWKVNLKCSFRVVQSSLLSIFCCLLQ